MDWLKNISYNELNQFIYNVEKNMDPSIASKYYFGENQAKLNIPDYGTLFTFQIKEKYWPYRPITYYLGQYGAVYVCN